MAPVPLLQCQEKGLFHVAGGWPGQREAQRTVPETGPEIPGHGCAALPFAPATRREQVAQELPDLIARHQERMAARDQWQGLLAQLKAVREAKGLSLADLTRLTGMDRSALSKLETGQRPNPTLETLVRYAEAVGKRLVVSLTDE